MVASIVSQVPAFAIYYLVLFVVCYVAIGQGQDYLYGEPVAGAGWRVALGAALLAGMLTWTRSNFATMFTENLGSTVLEAILWVGVFVLLYRFQPWHGLGLGLAVYLLASSIATMGVDSLLAPKARDQRYDAKATAKPIRRPTFSGGQTPTKPAEAGAPASK